MYLILLENSHIGRSKGYHDANFTTSLLDVARAVHNQVEGVDVKVFKLDSLTEITVVNLEEVTKELS